MFRDYDWLYNKYIVEKLSTAQIAKLSGCTQATIYNWLVKFSIPRRSQLEGRLIRFKEIYPLGDGVKTCYECKETKPLSEFQRDSSRRDGHAHICKTCKAVQARLWQHKNHDRVRESQRNWCRLNKDRTLKSHIKWRKSHPETWAADQKRWRDKHPEAAKANVKRWLLNNKDKKGEYSQRRRALKAAADGDFTAEQFEQLCEEFDWKCLRCGKPHSESPLTIDHIVPLSKGGSNDVSNIQPLCHRCNCIKRDKTIDYRRTS